MDKVERVEVYPGARLPDGPVSVPNGQKAEVLEVEGTGLRASAALSAACFSLPAPGRGAVELTAVTGGFPAWAPAGARGPRG